MSKKFIILVPDGMADHPQPQLEGRTPLEAADTPNMNALAAKAEVGLAATVPEGMHPGSDVANLAIFGYDSTEYYTGRAPLEAAGLGVELDGNVAFRCNLVTLENNRMKDFTAGHISSDEAKQVIETMHEQLGGNGISFHPGVSYRHLMLAPPSWNEMKCTPPHDIPELEIDEYLPKGLESEQAVELMRRSQELLKEHPVNRARRKEGKPEVSSIWLWGQGKQPAFPLLKKNYGVSGAVISAVDLVRGIGRLLGMEVIIVPGATGFVDTDYEGKAQAALDALTRHDLVYVHVEAPDEAGHMGDATLKARAIGDFDKRLMTPLLEGLRRYPEHRILLMPDHPTPCDVRTHTSEPVPYFLYDSTEEKSGPETFSEKTAKSQAKEIVVGHTLMGRLVGGKAISK